MRRVRRSPPVLHDERSEEHTSELQSPCNLVCRLLPEKKDSRLSEEKPLRPKPMLEIGVHPILWHSMNIFAAHKITEFIIFLFFFFYVSKDYFLNFLSLNNDVSID